MTERYKTVGRVALDSKNRVSITKALSTLRAVMRDQDLSNMTFKVEVNEVGQIMLTPEVSIAAHEIWLYRNHEALEAVQRGIKDADEGRVASLGSFAQFADDEIE